MQTTLRKVRAPAPEGAHAAHSVRLVPNFKNQLKIMDAAKKIETFSVYVYDASLHENVKMFMNTHLSGACHRKMSIFAHSTRFLSY